MGSRPKVLPKLAAPWTPRGENDDYGVTAEPTWRDVDWSAHMHRTRVAGRTLTYVETGEGDEPPALLLHGIAGSWRHWLENIPHLAQHRRVIAADLPGFGESEMPADRITISSYALWIEELCERLDLESAVIVGSSMGGFVGAEMAISYAHRVERLLLVAAAGISVTNLRRAPAVNAARVLAALNARTSARRDAVLRRPLLRHLVFSPFVRHPNRLDADLLRVMADGADGPGFVDALEALTSYDFRDRLEEIRCPTDLLWGADDILVPVEDAEEFSDLIPDCRTVVLDDTGHLPMLERPRSFNRCLDGFLGHGDDGGLPVGVS